MPMNTQNIQSEENIINNISLLKNNKNPLSILFILHDLKDIFISLWETLLSSIENNYSQSSQKQYLKVMDLYKQTWVFEALYNYYLNNDGILKFKNEIDNYFYGSFFYDISFFYYTLSQKDTFKLLFDIIEVFYTCEDIKKRFFSFDTYIEKKEYLETLVKDFTLLKYDKDYFFVIKFLNHFDGFDFTKIKLHFNNAIPSNIKLIKEVTLYVFANKNENKPLQDLFLDTFVFDQKIYDEVIEKLEEKKLFEVIAFLKNDIVSWVNYNIYIDVETKKNMEKLLINLSYFSQYEIDDKIKFLLQKEQFFCDVWEEKWDFLRIQFKRQWLEKRFHHIIDLTLWIHAIPQDTFYFLKSKNHWLDMADISLYNEVKDLILYIDKSYILWFIRPFLLKNIANHFNNSDQKYYVIKFIICVVLTKSYWEYEKVSKFFFNLESFYNNNFESHISRLLQFWWIFIFVFLLFLIAPFWVLLAFLIIGIKYAIMWILDKIAPELKMSLNFQVSSYALFLGIIAFLFSISIGYDENKQILYHKFQSVVNSITLPSSETINAFYGNKQALKADIMWTNQLK